MQWWQGLELHSEADRAGREAQRLWADHPPAFPLDTLMGAVYAPAVASPLSSFDAGDGPWLGSSLWLQLGRLARIQDQVGYDYAPAGRQIGLTAAILAQIAIPMLALLLCWQRREAIAAGSTESWTAMLIALFERCAPALAIACLLSAMLSWKMLGLNGATRLLLLLGCYLLYALAAASICWLAYRYIPDTSRATLVLASFWLFNIALARPTTTNLAGALYPLPTIDAMARKIEFERANGYNGVETRKDRERRFIAEALVEYQVKSIDQLPVNLSAILLKKEERHQREVFVRRLGELNELYRSQERFEQLTSFAAPMVGIQIASSALAATDFASEREQLNQADLYWDNMVRKVYEDIVVSSGPEGKKIIRGPEYWRQFPFVHPSLPSPAHALNSSLLPSAFLLLWAAAGFFLSKQQKENRSKTMEIEIPV